MAPTAVAVVAADISAGRKVIVPQRINVQPGRLAPPHDLSRLSLFASVGGLSFAEFDVPEHDAEAALCHVVHESLIGRP